MVFSSLLFVCVFLVACLFMYYFVGNGIKSKNKILLVFSLVFYAWSGPAFLLIMLFDTFVAWQCGKIIEKNRESEKNKNGYTAFVSSIVILLSVLFVFKYAMLALKGIQLLFRLPQFVIKIVLPIGISFYTFQLITYIVDVYKGRAAAETSFSGLLLYTAMFPQCIAGPIVRYDQISSEIKTREHSVNDFSKGVYRFSIGLAKKAVLANACASVADKSLATVTNSTSSMTLALGLLFYMLQIYLDFSAYSDMAIGMGLMMGFHFPENFNYPYISSSVKDFWRRWHISLSSFFRDYVYIPLGGSRAGVFRNVINLFVVWALTGLWHGAHLNFILWGLYYFVFLLIEKYVFKNKLDGKYKIIGHIVTPVIVYFGWILFRYSDFSELVKVLRGLFGINGNPFSDKTFSITLKSNFILLIFVIFACTPIYSNIRSKCYAHYNKEHRFGFPILVWDALFPIACLILSFLALIGNSYNPFLYFQF